jgi:hypothetical protein
MYRGPFILNKQQRDSMSADELATHVLRILQHNATHQPGGGMYSPGQLSSILAFEILAEDHFAGKGDRFFKQKFEEARQILYTRGLVMRDAGQSSVDFVILTAAGKAADTTAPVLGVWTAEKFLTSVRDNAGGDLDPVVEQYLGESYRAACADLWVSATFMLGAASEKALHLLAYKIADLVNDPKERAKLEATDKVRPIKEWILAQLKPLEKLRPETAQILRDVADKLNTLMTLYRYQRNDVGHPRDEVLKPDAGAIKAMLLAFSTYWTVVAKILRLPV